MALYDISLTITLLIDWELAVKKLNYQSVKISSQMPIYTVYVTRSIAMLTEVCTRVLINKYETCEI